MVTRRQFMKLGTVAGAGLLLPGSKLGGNAWAAPPAAPFLSPTLARYVDALPIPPVLPAATLATTGLTMAPAMHSFHRDLPPALTWGYNGASYLSPVYEAMRGSPVSFTAVNALGPHPLANSIDFNLHGAVTSDAVAPRVSVHLHGGNTEPGSDGYPEDTFVPGQTHPYDYNNNQEAAGLWFHDHALGITRLNVYAGLAGVYLLRDANELSRGLPSGPYEIPLVLQDRTLNANGSLFYPQRPWMPEFFGDVATVNGKAWPNLDVDRGLYRFRMYNGSNSRFYRLSFSNRMPLYQIGTDGGLLNAPVPLRQLLLGPGERADVLVDFSGLAPGTQLLLLNDAPTPFPGAAPNARDVNFPLPEIMRFTVRATAGLPAGSLLTAPLRPPIPALPPPVRQRFLTLTEIVGPQGPLVALLNLLYWDEPSIDPTLMERPRVNTVEQWNLINLTSDAHPIHLHLVQFQILNRQRLNTTRYLKAYTATGPRQVLSMAPPGGPTVSAGYPPIDPAPYVTGSVVPPAPQEQGWKDTVVAMPGEVTRILVPFGGGVPGAPFGNSFTGRYVWHCHILEHEDNEMMLPYEVVP